MRGSQNSEITVLRGGLDLVTPDMMKKPGFAIASINYEAEARGYSRMSGYERFDGQPKPSEPDYAVLDFVSGSTEVTEGQTVTGATSGATGIALYDGTLTGGTYGGGNAVGTLILYAVQGTFQDAENLEVSASTVAVANGASELNAASTDELNAQYVLKVTGLHRSAIAKPAGDGPIRGVGTLRGDVYCWRDNIGQTEGQMFKATTSGWVKQSLGHTVLFDGATAEFLQGETLTGGISGATATIERVVLNLNAWDGSGEGLLVLSGISGTFQDNEDITSASGAALAKGASFANTLPPGGRYESIEHNFYATEQFTRMYAVNGVGRGFEWDGTVFAPCYTGLSDALDKPAHIGVQAFHLFFGYVAGSLLFSGLGQPLVFGVLQGAGEIGYGEKITGLQSDYRDSLIVTGRNFVGYVVGTDSSTFDARTISTDSGGVENTLQVIGQPHFIDDQGVRDLSATDAYGDWQMGTVSRLIEPIIRRKKKAGLTPAASIRVREKDQYRVYYDNGSGLLAYFGRGKPEFMELRLGFSPSCMHSGEKTNGNEILLAGGEDGYVYELDAGTSEDGAVMTSFIRLAFDNQKTPNMDKRYHRARFEADAEGQTATINMTAEYSYAQAESLVAPIEELGFQGQGGFWNEANWNEFYWSTSLKGQAYADLEGIGENISYAFFTESATEHPHTISNVTTFYTRRRALR